ncbi:RNA polymerase sigma factor [Catenuloplanes japonicus]|uniref:hypothetical protein n=1 Tax=Catenuloplanes japonicus TaxID=33876 RepID=UPI000526A0EA|nr:hypothetical protein [Catenuloplanes japonicus]
MTAQVGIYFDRSEKATQVMQDAGERALRIVHEAQVVAAQLHGQADGALRELRALGEPVVEIAGMVDIPVSEVKAALARAKTTSTASGPGTPDVEVVEVVEKEMPAGLGAGPDDVGEEYGWAPDGVLVGE